MISVGKITVMRPSYLKKHNLSLMFTEVRAQTLQKSLAGEPAGGPPLGPPSSRPQKPSHQSFVSSVERLDAAISKREPSASWA